MAALLGRAFVVMSALAVARVSHGRWVPGLVAADRRRPRLGGASWRTSVWRSCGTGLAVAAVVVAFAFARPAGASAVSSARLCVLLLGRAAVISWQQRRA